MKILIRIAQMPVHAYRFFLSPWVGNQCRFHPTCSAYMLEALEKHGVFKGILLGLRRVSRCHPWSGNGGYDPVPKRFTQAGFFGYNRTDTKNTKKDA